MFVSEHLLCWLTVKCNRLKWIFKKGSNGFLARLLIAWYDPL